VQTCSRFITTLHSLRIIVVPLIWALRPPSFSFSLPFAVVATYGKKQKEEINREIDEENAMNALL
jgi:hypothetical protein